MVTLKIVETKIEKCKFNFVETIPADCKFAQDTKLYPSIGKSIIKMLKKAKKSINAISFYFSLRSKDVPGGPYKTADLGDEIYNQLEEAAKRGVKISLIANIQGKGMDDSDMSDLMNAYPNNVQIGFIDMSHKTEGYVGGICHTKLWIIDDKYFYMGSANMDWRAYNEIVETGIVGKNCSNVLSHLMNIFIESWKLVDGDKSSSNDSRHFDTSAVEMKTTCLSLLPVKISANPNLISDAVGVQNDLLTLLNVIDTARKNVYMTTYEYSNYDQFVKPPLADYRVQDALIIAAKDRNVKINIIVDEKCGLIEHYAKSLLILSKIPGITIKLFKIENKSLPNIPFAKLWHSKLAISESKLWISTNNISPSYFKLTCGAGILFDSNIKPYSNDIMPLINDATNHFMRYWDSAYTHPFKGSDICAE